ncbi:MAG: hypothetical protein DHS20C02_04970 [Micavibrio sp.]|nr:MAG: hypothetical protein DHS20C02_04970 [Micavibrio sp.]
MKTPSNKMTTKRIKRIKEMLDTDQYHQHQIAAIEQVNPGRVSEIKHGQWDWKLSIEDKQQSLL